MENTQKKQWRICRNIDCHEKLLTYQEIESGYCQKHGGLLDDRKEEE